MKKIKFAFVVLLMCLSAAAFCEEAVEEKPTVYNNAIGFVYTPGPDLGSTNDTLIAGLQYQHWFDNVGLQMTGCMYYDQNYNYYTGNSNTYGQKLDWKILGGAQFILCTFNVDNLNWIKDDTVFRLYFWLNGGVGARDLDMDNQNLAYLYAGTGIGLEAVFWKHISIPFELGYSGQFLNDGGFDIAVSSGVRFRF